MRLSDRLIVALSALACLVFVASLRDVALPVLSDERRALPPPPEITDRDGRLTVRVVDAEGLPVAGASVRAFLALQGRYYDAGAGLSAADGTLTLRNLPRGVLWLLVEAEGRARRSTQLVVGAEPRNATVALEARRELAVKVVDDAERPIERATVLVSSADPLPYGALTDAEGQCVLARLGASPYTVKVSARGYESVTRSDVRQDVTITLRPLGSLAVVVEDSAGKPVTGADVFIAGSSLWPARRAETDETGQARIVGLLAGNYDLKAAKGALVSETVFGLRLERGAQESIRLRLEAGRLVPVIVTSGPGDSPLVVAGADVVLVEGGVSSFPLRGRTGADGKVTLGPLGAGPASVAASAPGFVARGAIPVPEPLEGEVRVSLIKGATLRGRVLDERGFPVDGATIEVIGTDSFGLPVAQTPLLMGFQRVHFAWAMSGPVPLIPAGELGVMPGPVPPIPAAGQPIAAASPGLGALPEVGEAIEPWVSRGDGTFEATPVAPGRMRALVRHPSYVEGMSRTVSLMPGETAEVEVVLRQGGMLEGRVLDSSGFPVAGARVDVSAVRGTLEQTALTASDGSFAFAAVPREIVVAAGRPDDLSRIVFKENVEVPAGGRAELEITLPKLREAVAIVVEDDERRPVGVAQVTVMSLDAKTPLRQTLFSDADGVVTVEDARALDLRILVEAPSFVRATRVVQSAPERIQINLSRGTVVKGRVTAVRGRSYVAGATVVLIAEAVRQVGRTGDDGAYAFRDVALGPVRVIATHPDFADGEVSAVVQATGRADRPFELPDLELTDPGSIEGRVLDAEGRPVAGARVGVGLVPAYLPAGALPPDVALTDEQGRFTLSSLRPGRADVEAYHAQAGRGRVPGVVVDSGRTTSNVSIRLAAEPEVDEPPQAGGLAVTLGDRSAPGGTEVVIAQVAPASEAERAGLRAGDVLLAIEGSRPADMRDARARLSGSPGTDVVLEIRRGAGNERLRVTRELVRR